MIQVRYTRNLFLRGICIVYLFAFLSFYIQIPGLYGDNGILPANSQVDLKSNTPLLSKLKQKHTWLWFAPYIGLNVEYMLDVLALVGVIFSFLGFVSQKFCIAPIFAGLWSLYYSLYQIGQTFIFQWDNLLLEAGFLCTIIAPIWYSHRGKISTPSDGITFWSVRWLLFRLMFSTGVVKLASRCPAWWSLDALSIYFESQCIPTPLAWYAHHLPKWFLRLNTAAVNIFELVIPFLFFFPNRRVRLVAFYIQIFLQTGIILTGNYNFSNFLTICLCVSLLDDQFFKKKSKNMSSVMSYISTGICFLVYSAVLYGFYVYYKFRLTDKWTVQLEIAFTEEQFTLAFLFSAIPISFWIGLTSLIITIINALTESLSNTKGIQKKFTHTVVTLIYTLIVGFVFLISLVPHVALHPPLNSTVSIQSKRIYNKVEHLHLVNSYGLFRHMTGVNGRPEIIIEGSNDLDGPWKEYEFLYKPGNINNSLPFVAPHQPRLDWQMWFAALGSYRQNPWLFSLAYRLLNGQPEVLALMNQVGNPFHNKPPKFIKASLYHYHYTSWTHSGQSWWRRERIQEYFPVFSRDDASLLEYLSKMKVISDKTAPKVTNTWLKLTLDSLRSAVGKLEASLFLWGVFTAGWVIILTAYNNVSPKKK